MARYIRNRLLLAVLVILGVSLVAYFILHLSGDPVSLLMPLSATTEQIEEFRERMGYNDPVMVQYSRFLWNILNGDFGNSIRYNQPALPIVMNHLPNTLELAGLGILFAILIGVPLGVLAAVNNNSVVDFIVRIIALLGQAMPGFWFGVMLILLFSLRLGWLPTSGKGDWHNIVMPVICIGMFSMASITRMTRSSMLEVLSQDYIRTAHAKGLESTVVIYKHALRNALLSLTTIIGMEFGHLLSGSVVVETVFGWPGVGRLAINAIYSRDYILVQAVLIISAIFYVFVNLIVDILYSYIDPRIKLGGLKQ